MKEGDKVTIIPRDDHSEDIRKHYGETLVIEDVRVDSYFKKTFYKVEGVEGYARETDLKPINQ